MTDEFDNFYTAREEFTVEPEMNGNERRFSRGKSEIHHRPEKIPISEKRTISVEGTSWSPNKNVHLLPHGPEKHTKRKLSESRGVKLPDIKIMSPHHSISTSTAGSSMEYNSPEVSHLSPPLTCSPVGHVIRHDPATVQTPSSGSSSLTRTGKLLQTLLDICIYLPDNRGIQFSVKGGRIAKCRYLSELVWNHQQIPHYLAEQCFALWMVSPLLEVQLKPHHVPFQVRKCWQTMLRKFTTSTEEEIQLDEPILMLRRNVLLSKRKQTMLANENEKVVELLSLDAKDNILSSKWPCDLKDALYLAALDMALIWGPYNDTQHTRTYIRDSLDDFLPENHLSAAKSFSLFGLSFGGCKGQEEEVLQHYRNISGENSHQIRLLYLEACMKLPFYGAALFTGQIERPPSSSKSRLWRHQSGDLQIQVAISREFFSIIDPKAYTTLLTKPIFDCNWQRSDCSDFDINFLPSLFLHFPSGISGEESCLLQIFSRQSIMMDALLNSCWDATENEMETQSNQSNNTSNPIEQNDRNAAKEVGQEAIDCKETSGAPLTHLVPSSPVLSNKLERLCLATFDSSGSCINAVGSLKKVLEEQPIDQNGQNETEPS